MGRLDNRIALVTGGSRGIGRDIALELAREGAKLAINYNSSADKAKVVGQEIEQAGSECLVLQGDVSKPDEARALVTQTIEKYGRLDILVNNAGITRDTTLKRMTDEKWHEVINTNLNSAYYTLSAALPTMTEQEYGRVINMSSFVAQAGNIGQTNYAASKAALIGFTKSAARELAKSKITVNCVAPGFIGTEMVSAIPEDVQQKLLATIPMRRFGEPSEIARAVVYLVADGDYITGQQINVNGGNYM